MSENNNDNSAQMEEDDDDDDTNEDTEEGMSNNNNAEHELPFLVTHWLANYQCSGDSGESSDHHNNTDDGVQNRIRNAAAELAAAFAEAGAFGTQRAPRLLESDNHYRRSRSEVSPANATFSDVQRQWRGTCHPRQLESIVQASSTAIRTMERVRQDTNHASIPLAARERVLESIKRPESGRTLQDAIQVENNNNNSSTNGSQEQQNSSSTPAVAPSAASSLHIPIVARTNATDTPQNSSTSLHTMGPTADAARTVQLSSQPRELTLQAAGHMRRFLELRDDCRRQETQLGKLRRSLEYQETAKRELIERRSAVLVDATMDIEQQTIAMDIIKDEEQNCLRVSAQLQRQIQSAQRKFSTDQGELARIKQKVYAAHQTVQRVTQNFWDPFRNDNAMRRPGLVHRNLAVNRMGYQPTIRKLCSSTSTATSRKSLLMHRLSHAVTINTHLAYPVYCLRFDRTGRYFVTGADDYLVKLFCFGSDASVGIGRHDGKPLLDQETYHRGAIHVCTLRGHAGVINDIDVSSDNAFLATASEDGDVRVWGLKDGSPIAILRGHVGGANMVSWSALTPYRLVTTAVDGLARTWDIRAACVKRYGSLVGKRAEYREIKSSAPITTSASSPAVASAPEAAEASVPLPPIPSNGPAEASVPLPPIPSRDTDTATVAQAAALPVVPLPPIPLPPGNAPLPIAAQQQNGEDEPEPGSFVANSNLDEGVKLLSKLQHGATLAERSDGVGTRGRRAAVKVICVARCPFGGHFATGSDDGVCRVWRDEDNSVVESVDALAEVARPLNAVSGTVRACNQLLLTLKGHLSAITDLHYSHAGDRIMTASQRDGVVRIWSWRYDPALIGVASRPTTSRLDGEGCSTSHILIKLSNPAKVAKAANQVGRRRPASASANVSCDDAQWINDDSLVVTSQCELVKQSGADIVPGSQYIFLWDTFTGHCLVGLPGAHDMQCSVVIPHPTESSILCSAGNDGVVNVWDWETGKAIFSHKNIVDFGPVDQNDRGKISGFLDGAFFPDGCGLVLTDDSGRVSVFDCKSTKKYSTGSSGWMREQYFANDYYELMYDTNGYCIERGSERPPHLAPRSVRCTHSGVPWSSSVTEKFKGLVGPFPVSVMQARQRRQAIRTNAKRIVLKRFKIGANRVCEYDPRSTTLLGHKMPELVRSTAAVAPPPAAVSSPRSTTVGSAQRLSSNWRWGDAFSELRDDVPDGDDSEDEEFELNDRNTAAENVQLSESEESDLERGYVVEDSPRRQNFSALRDLLDSDDEENVEFASTNNTPSGRYVADYDRHFWNYGNSRGNLLTKSWVLRTESASSYTGRKRYAPQIGDSVVYIPRAHFETITSLPQLEAPWTEWPEQSVWPLVSCVVRNLRYRLPFKPGFLPSSNNVLPKKKGIVVIITLEITGVPVLAGDRDLSWPSPTFVEQTGGNKFELSLFEADTDDFVIPLGLYQARLRDLERTLQADDNPQVEAIFSSGAGSDSEYLLYSGRIDGVVPSDDVGATHLCGSGYRGVSVAWESATTGDDENRVSPWELRTGVENPEVPARPSLSDEEKDKVRDAIAAVKGIQDVDEYFGAAVDQSRYYDYGARVEVPMDLSFITTRLNSDYYASRHSVIRDVRLIHENAVKYNGQIDDLADLALSLVEEFQKRILTAGEIQEWNDLEEEMLARAPPRTVGTLRSVETDDAEQVGETGTVEDETGALRRSNRTRRPSRRRESSPSQHFQRARRSTRQRRSRRQRASSRFSAEGERAVLGQPLEALNTRGRANRGINQRLQQQQSTTRETRATRSAAPVNVSPNRQATRNIDSAAPAVRQRQSRRGGGNSNVSEHSRRSIESPSEADPTDEPGETGNDDDYENVDEGSEVMSDELAVTSDSESEVVAQPRSSRLRRTSNALTGSSDSENNQRPARSTRIRISRRRSSTTSGCRSSSEDETRPTRATRTRRQDQSSSDEIDAVPEEESDEESLSESDESVPTKRQTNPSRSSAKRPQSRKTTSTQAHASRTRPELSYIEGNSDDDELLDDSDDNKPEANRRRRVRVSTGRRAASYADIERSDVDEEDSSVESDRPKRSSNRKRRGSTNGGDGNGRRKRSRAESTSTSTAKPWPEINVSEITNLSTEILERVRLLDPDGFFAVPVVEAAPEVREDYLGTIEEPMDLRTIEEERLPTYRAIRDLQQDLLLMFENCFLFNGRDNEYSQVAMIISDSLNDIFRGSCKDLNIKISHRW